MTKTLQGTVVIFEVSAKSGLRLRARATSRSQIVARMPNGTQVTRTDAIDYNGHWYAIEVFLNSKTFEGYTHSKHLTAVVQSADPDLLDEGEIPSSEAPTAIEPRVYFVNASSLRLRDKPGSQGTVLMAMRYGTVVTKVEESDKPDWWEVKTASGSMMETGYAHKGYLAPMRPPPFVKVDVSFISNVQASISRVQKFVGAYASVLNDELLAELNNIVERYGINKTPRRFSHFMAQLAHESANFSKLEENLYYRPQRLLEVFARYFTDLTHAEQYARNPEKLANRVYANRMGNGDEASEDGYRYRGRGYIQLTGKDNYINIGDRIGKDLVNSPDLVAEDPKIALLVAADYWDSRNINAAADLDDVERVTELINGGHKGLDDRERLLRHAKSIWGG